MIDQEVGHLLTKKEAEEQLVSLQQRREALHAERDGKKLQRSQLGLQLMRLAQKAQHSQLGISASDAETASLHCQEREEGSKGRAQGTHAAALSCQHAGEGDVQTQTQQAQQQALRVESSTSEVLSSSGVESAQVTQQEEELQRQAASLDDAVDTCDAQLAYLESAIAKSKAVWLPDPFAFWGCSPCSA